MQIQRDTKYESRTILSAHYGIWTYAPISLFALFVKTSSCWNASQYDKIQILHAMRHSLILRQKPFAGVNDATAVFKIR